MHGSPGGPSLEKKGLRFDVKVLSAERMIAVHAAADDKLWILRQFLRRRHASVINTSLNGCFQEMMQVELVNDGPVTILVDSQKSF